MKKLTAAVLALALVFALAAGALAAPITMYAQEDAVKVYADKSTTSGVLKELKKGDKVLVDTEDGSWYNVTVGEGLDEIHGWIESKYLSTKIPPSVCSHEWSIWTILKDATCTVEGQRTRSCEKCGSVETETIPKTAHIFSDWTTTTQATCTAEGQMTRWCKICGTPETKKLDRLPHSFGDWVVRRAATCTKEGERVHWCKNCSLEETAPIEKLPHNYGDWSVRRAATCTAEGERVRWCKDCGREQTKAIDKLPHDYTAWTVRRAATCTAEGESYRVCRGCGKEQTKPIDKLPHDYGDWYVTVEATDHSAGVRAKVCKSCGRVVERSFDPEGTLRRKDKGSAVREIQQLLADQGYLKQKDVDGSYGSGTEKAIMKFQKDQGITPDGVAWPETIRRLHHDFGPWETVTELSRFGDGERVRVCKECGYSERVVLPARPFFTRKQQDTSIKTLQKMLNDLGYKCGEEDGSFGRRMTTAFEAFAIDRGLDIVLDEMRPADVDELVNAWFEWKAGSGWRGEGGKDSPVNLILTVTPDGEENGLPRYTWRLSNLGGERCRFVTLLLGFGEGHDFTGENIVLVVDRSRLKADAENSLKGEFIINPNWGEGTPQFCAAATDDNGGLWLSNAAKG